MNQQAVINELVRRKGDGSWRELAIKLDISQSYICDVVAGNRLPGKKLLQALGLVAVRQYIESDK